PAGWLDRVQSAQSEAELTAIRRSVARGCPYGAFTWVERTAVQLGLESSLHDRGRPRGRVSKETEAGRLVSSKRTLNDPDPAAQPDLTGIWQEDSLRRRGLATRDLCKTDDFPGIILILTIWGRSTKRAASRKSQMALWSSGTWPNRKPQLPSGT